tara:strand:+ start:321 stop:689 length:369 start_codon:yes stop_codon:yes gene_type:complete
MPEQLTKESIMTQQLLTKLIDLKNKAEKDYDNLMKNDERYILVKRKVEGLQERKDTINEIIKIVEEICPYDEPLHNHHDGCPSCDNCNTQGYVISPWVHLDNCIDELEKQVARIKRTVKVNL